MSLKLSSVECAVKEAATKQPKKTITAPQLRVSFNYQDPAINQKLNARLREDGSKFRVFIVDNNQTIMGKGEDRSSWSPDVEIICFHDEAVLSPPPPSTWLGIREGSSIAIRRIAIEEFLAEAAESKEYFLSNFPSAQGIFERANYSWRDLADAVLNHEIGHFSIEVASSLGIINSLMNLTNEGYLHCIRETVADCNTLLAISSSAVSQAKGIRDAWTLYILSVISTPSPFHQTRALLNLIPLLSASDLASGHLDIERLRIITMGLKRFLLSQLSIFDQSINLPFESQEDFVAMKFSEVASLQAQGLSPELSSRYFWQAFQTRTKSIQFEVLEQIAQNRIANFLGEKIILLPNELRRPMGNLLRQAMQLPISFAQS
ncbi:hypothetical protein COT42_08195 [Candidatus Saganbacteria bacterium CG08_land_8_20_14_0_20_45_16]|uniref:Uncharacterized protein n=1 Tax=Candidatus Saganbacteria bacterium CG08_land_8_20_14_0_20_45_16 TaxID=2014293 RepID=A0A2H0XU17_UNCSA|nr:MAG: hypothetical protein COT42_08195 [Candidatus Saganbacteria bacterium CG08_land_8_20_14_0_20_45_16]